MDNKTKAGWVLSVIVGGVMIMAGSSKLFGFAPAEVTDNMTKIGLGNNLTLIGALEVASAIVFLIPRSASAGLLLVCSFWGGAIVAHLALGDNGFFPAIVLGLLAWAGAYLRVPGSFASFTTADAAPVSEPAGSE